MLDICFEFRISCFVLAITLSVMQPRRLLVNIWFQNYFIPLTGVFFTFPSRYLFTIGLWKYLALPVSSGRFTRAIRVSSYSRTLKKLFRFRLRGFHPLGRRFPAASAIKTICNFLCIECTINALQPRELLKPLLQEERSEQLSGLGLFAFARRYWRNTY